MEKSYSDLEQINDIFAAVNTLISREIDHLSVYHAHKETQKFEMCMYKISVLIDAKTAMRLALDGKFQGYI